MQSKYTQQMEHMSTDDHSTKGGLYEKWDISMLNDLLLLL